jgi:hypothetical protein
MKNAVRLNPGVVRRYVRIVYLESELIQRKDRYANDEPQ